jgi:tryptophan-rich sensory protein
MLGIASVRFPLASHPGFGGVVCGELAIFADGAIFSLVPGSEFALVHGEIKPFRRKSLAMSTTSQSAVRSQSSSAHILPFVVTGLATLAAAAFGSQFTPDAWYSSLNKPPLHPPGWVFGPVWTVLYCLMAVAAGLVWSQAGWKRASGAMILFFSQLILNAAWSPLFFGLKSPGLALVDIVLLECAILATMISFFRLRPLSGWLLVPYLAWVTFATYLNFMIWRLN